MTSVAPFAPSGVTPADPLVPLSDLHLGTHEAGIVAAVELAADFFHDRVEGFLTAGDRWQCFACDTWNESSTTECVVCEFDRHGFDTTQEAGR